MSSQFNSITMVTQKDVSFLPKQRAKVTKQRVLVLTCINIVIFTFNMVKVLKGAKVALKFFSHNNIFS